MEQRHTIEKKNTYNDIMLKEEKKNIVKNSIAVAINAACLVAGIALKDPSTIAIGGIWGAISLKKVVNALDNKAKIQCEIEKEGRAL
jgi:hypothetical protein